MVTVPCAMIFAHLALTTSDVSLLLFQAPYHRLHPLSSSQSQPDPGRSASEVEDLRMDQDLFDLNNTELLKSPVSTSMLPNANESYDDTA